MTRREIFMPAASGVTISVVCFGLGILGEIWLDWNWLTITAVLLASTVLGAVALSVTPADHPPTWGGGFWSAYTEMSGREAAGGGLSGMTRLAGGWNVPLLVMAIPPTLALIAIVVLSLLET